jgi:zeta-carotene desaturase
MAVASEGTSSRPVLGAGGLRIVVVGGGVAGIAAAVALESAGVGVTLIESRKSLGGRASSFVDPKSGAEIDNCQHVLLGCCTNLLDLYRRLGCVEKVRFDRTIHFRDENGRRFDLSGNGRLPAPTHLSLGFAGFGLLTVKEKAAYARAMLAMLRLGKAGRRKLADVSFGQWLEEHHQPPSLVQKMYEPVLVGALNEDCRKCSAMYAIQVFQDAMLANSRGYVVGVPTVPLSQLYGDRPCGDTRLGTRVEEICFAGNRVAGVKLSDGEMLQADVVVLATNHHAVQKWVPAELKASDARFAKLDQIQAVPILGVHMEFDRPVLEETHAAFVAGPLQWVFRKDSAGKVLAGVISAARDYVGRPKDQCLKEFERQIQQMLPGAAGAKLLDGTIVIERRATFAPLPGIDRLRPTQAPPPGGIENLFLAGDYTQTGWPATMEGAARGGYLAAGVILGKGDGFLVDDLSVQWPARLLGL